MGSKEGEDGRERGDIVRGRAGFWGGVVDVSTEDCDEDVLVPAARFNRVLLRPRILIYPWQMALRRVVLEGEPRAREM